MTIREVLEFCYVLVGAHGVTQAIGEDAIIPAVNLALINIYNYKWYLWSWQEYREAFTTIPSARAVLTTRYPILNPNYLLFHEGPAPSTDDIITWCEPCVQSNWCTSCACSCLDTACEPLKLDYQSPQDKLCAMQYQVSWGGRLGWLWGRIIRVDTGRKKCNWLYVLYQRWFNLIKDANDEFPLPDNFISAFAYMYAHFVIPPMGQYRQGDDTNFYNLSERELEYLKLRDNVAPKSLAWFDGAQYYQQTIGDALSGTSWFAPKNLV